MALTGLVLGAALVIFVIVLDLWLTRADAPEGSAARKAVYAVFGALSGLAVVVGLALAAVNLARDGGLTSLAVLLIVVGLTGALVLAPPSRRTIARLLPIEPRSLRSAAGLILILWITEAQLVELIAGTPVETTSISYAALAIQAATLVGVALAIVGVPHRRTFREALGRLGISVPTPRQVNLAVLLVFAVFVLAVIATSVLNLVAPEIIEQLEETSDEMTAELDTFWGAIAIGLGAAIGEELLFRGAIQPRFGLVFTALVFAVLHVQYHPALIFTSVLPAGVVLGLERKYLGTTACIITHMLYNTIAVLVSGG